MNRALDSDDIELVQLLLDEGKLDLNEACGLHYAAAYCHPRTLAHLLELDIAGKMCFIIDVKIGCYLMMPTENSLRLQFWGG